MPAFDTADLHETAARIRAKLDDDQEAIDLLQQLIDSHEAQAEMWSEQLGSLESSQKALCKAVVMLAKQSQSQGKRLESMNRGLASLYRMQKAQGTGKPLGKSMLNQGQGAVTNHDGGRSLEETSRLGLLSKAIINTLGPRGGHSYPYNPGLASKMMLAGTLTARQHKTWKASNRLHDDPYQVLQGRRAG